MNEMDTRKPARSELSEHSAYAGTPGAAYVDDFLPGLGTEDAAIAEMINAGSLLICPRCLFLHLPTFSLPILLGSSDPSPVDACDVCAHVYGAANHWRELQADAMEAARTGLTEARVERAVLFYDLWMGASLAADTWVNSTIGKVLIDLKRSVRAVPDSASEESAGVAE